MGTSRFSALNIFLGAYFMENLGTSLWITLIGMGLVFIAIILLWGLMAFLVTILKEKEGKPETLPETKGETQAHNIKEKVAAVAVAIAINTANQSQYQGKHPTADASVSNWQSSFRQTSSFE
jgi:Na+-transporting methylmalonyl-CoA/oxaloacetate decarboxylase gamma subunit